MDGGWENGRPSVDFLCASSTARYDVQAISAGFWPGIGLVRTRSVALVRTSLTFEASGQLIVVPTHTAQRAGSHEKVIRRENLTALFG